MVTVWLIQLPPLRDRIEEIPVLVSHFIGKFNTLHHREENGTAIRGIEPEALEILKAHRWPGNIRELENVIERAFVLETTDLITAGSLPDALIEAERPVAPAKPVPASPQGGPVDYQNEKERFEREFIIRALKLNGGRINQTVTKAGIPKNTLLRKMRKYDIQPEEYLPGS